MKLCCKNVIFKGIVCLVWSLVTCHLLVRASGSLKFELKGHVLGQSRLHELFLGKLCVSRLKGDVHCALQQTLGCTTAVLAVIKFPSNIAVCCRCTHSGRHVE